MVYWKRLWPYNSPTDCLICVKFLWSCKIW